MAVMAGLVPAIHVFGATFEDVDARHEAGHDAGKRDEARMQRDFTVIVERDDEGYYVASVPSLAGCHTQARSLDDLIVRVQEAIAVCLEDEGAADLPALEFVGIQRISVPA
jgi:predicted RNase H-like HicB family nuclease